MKDFGGETPYSIMFGPDICGYVTKKVHAILTHKDKNHLIKSEVPAKTDQLSHVYTLHIKPDNTYTVRALPGGSRRGGVRCWGSCQQDAAAAP